MEAALNTCDQKLLLLSSGRDRYTTYLIRFGRGRLVLAFSCRAVRLEGSARATAPGLDDQVSVESRSDQVGVQVTASFFRAAKESECLALEGFDLLHLLRRILRELASFQQAD